MKLFKRRILLINKPFQFSIIAWFSLLSIILIAIFYSTIWYFFYNLKKEAALAGLPGDHVFYIFINQQKAVIDHVFIFSSVLALFVILLGGLFLSNKVAGPLYRLTKHLKKHSLKDCEVVKFRKGDYFLEIQDAFNEFIKK